VGSLGRFCGISSTEKLFAVLLGLAGVAFALSFAAPARGSYNKMAAAAGAAGALKTEGPPGPLDMALKSSAGALKTVRRILPSPSRHWVGDAFHVYPVFHDLAFTKELSPWLMFDYAAPKAFSPTTKRRGVGQHPHRGFETVTLAFQGEVEHGDSVGNRGVIGPGDVQWMTAARGIIHEEFHSVEFSKRGGTFEMAQLWVNLPRSSKMVAPRYQGILKDDIPVVPVLPVAAEVPEGLAEGACGADDGSFARLIAGQLGSSPGAADTVTPIELFDVTLKSNGAVYDIDMPEGHNVIVFVRRGSIEVGWHKKADGQRTRRILAKLTQLTCLLMPFWCLSGCGSTGGRTGRGAHAPERDHAAGNGHRAGDAAAGAGGRAH